MRISSTAHTGNSNTAYKKAMPCSSARNAVPSAYVCLRGTYGNITSAALATTNWKTKRGGPSNAHEL
ncbi:hypothetical protein Scep_013970 [Stephania cephalantha]|uniref:Uncharacterized protein n=1 Tax=Stephania cephalantha TaxID=152367 RepID=A0AAP0P061_9MAGN